MLDIKKAKIGDVVILRDNTGIEISRYTKCSIEGFYQGLDKLVKIKSLDKMYSSTVYPHRLHAVSNSINIKYSNGEN